MDTGREVAAAVEAGSRRDSERCQSAISPYQPLSARPLTIRIPRDSVHSPLSALFSLPNHVAPVIIYAYCRRYSYKNSRDFLSFGHRNAKLRHRPRPEAIASDALGNHHRSREGLQGQGSCRGAHDERSGPEKPHDLSPELDSCTAPRVVQPVKGDFKTEAGKPTWLHLERKGNLLLGSMSQDGKNWTKVEPKELRAEAWTKNDIVAGVAASYLGADLLPELLTAHHSGRKALIDEDIEPVAPAKKPSPPPEIGVNQHRHLEAPGGVQGTPSEERPPGVGLDGWSSPRPRPTTESSSTRLWLSEMSNPCGR